MAARLAPEDARAIARIIWRNQQRRAAAEAAKAADRQRERASDRSDVRESAA